MSSPFASTYYTAGRKPPVKRRNKITWPERRGGNATVKVYRLNDDGSKGDYIRTEAPTTSKRAPRQQRYVPDLTHTPTDAHAEEIRASRQRVAQAANYYREDYQ